MTAPSMADTQEITRSLTLILLPGSISELRVLIRPGRVQSGYFDDRARMAKAAASVSGRYPVYMTPNPVNPDLKARSYNRLKDYSMSTTADSDILARRWLLLDFDPERPSGISSTDAEHEAAIERARACQQWLTTSLGFPEGILGDSGNGAHALFRVDLTNDPASLELITRCLKAVDFQFTDGAVTVDTGIGNAARIWKVYGTRAVKGDSLPERPHRTARLLCVPPVLNIVGVDLLQKLAALVPQPPNPTDSYAHNGRAAHGEFNVAEWVSRFNLPVAFAGAWQGGHKWVLNPCPFDSAHNNKSAYIVQHVSGAIAAGCHHKGCASWHWSELRAHYEGSTNGHTRSHGQNEQYNGGATGPDQTDTPSQADDWPDPPGAAAFDGLAGDIVRTIDPYTEADQVAVLAHFLAAFGCCVDKGPHIMIGATRHDARIFPVIVGDSSKARKGDSSTPILAIFRLVDGDWAATHIVGGMGSGEGLINAVRDPTDKDAGVTDKRLFVMESEFGGVLRVMGRQGNILSVIVRQAWDRGDLQTLTKGNPQRATGAHIVIVGHITEGELRRELTNTEAANGFANRFIWLAVRRSKRLPMPEPFKGAVVEGLARKVAESLNRARTVGEMHFSAEGRELWEALYFGGLSDAKAGLVGGVISRSETQVRRLSVLYALLDGRSVIEVSHLQSAVELWAYSERSAAHIFGDATGDNVADTIYRALKRNGPMTRKQLSDLFSRHESAAHITQALTLLLEKAKVRTYSVESDGGRPVEMWEVC